MGKISKLSPELIKKIAAGEVVERPASALKEMIENSIDAGSTEITAKIEEGGTKKIAVSDNGTGIEKDDLELVFELHSTSKLKSETDLKSIFTLGFRGEALATIASVSESVKLQTKTKDSSLGYSVEKRHNEEIIIKKAGTIKEGTAIEINGLFDPIPARKKFLKSPSTETKHLLNTFTEILLPFLDIHAEVYVDGKLVTRFTKTNDLKTRIFEAFGNEVSESLIYTNEQNAQIQGAIVQPSKARKYPKIQQIYINNRFIKSSLIHKAVQQAYQGFMHRDLKADYLINIKIDPKNIDINVHPRKLEVRFTNEQEIFSLVYRFVQKLLNSYSKKDLIGIKETIKEDRGFASFLKNDSNNASAQKKLSSFKLQKENKPSSYKVKQALDFTKAVLGNSQNAQNTFDASLINDAKSEHYSPAKNSPKSIMQLLNTYILFELDNELIIIDQHAAAEKILFEKLIQNVSQISRKQLLVPEIIELKNSIDKKAILRQKNELKRLGYIIEDFGGNTIQITEIPELANISGAKDIINDFLKNEDELSIHYNESHFTQYNISKEVYLRIATIACHSSIRAGQKLSDTEMLQLIEDVGKLETQPFCPHGRPIFIKLSKSKIDELFQRHL